MGGRGRGYGSCASERNCGSAGGSSSAARSSGTASQHSYCAACSSCWETNSARLLTPPPSSASCSSNISRPTYGWFSPQPIPRWTSTAWRTWPTRSWMWQRRRSAPFLILAPPRYNSYAKRSVASQNWLPLSLLTPELLELALLRGGRAPD